MSRSKRIGQIVIVVIAGLALVGSGFWVGFVSGKNYPQNITISDVTNLTPPGDVSWTADFSTFWQAWQDINNLYLYNPSTTAQEKVYGAVNGLMNSLGDPYSEFFDPNDNSQFQQNLNGDFGGIGAELGESTSSQIVIIAPIKGTPAEAAGLKPDDEILGINGSSTDGMSLDDAVSLIRGTAGTKVTLSVFRAGWQAPQSFTITRADIAVPTLDFSMKGTVAVIALHEFTQDSDQLFFNALQQAQKNNATGIVLDLRDDPGGYLQVAVDIAGYFLKPGTLIVKEVGRTVPEQDYTASGNGALANFPIVILINGGSASAAEILSGALHDDRGVKLVGEKSFGKGTVQQVINLTDGSAIKLTVAHWVLPSGRILDHDGLVPDYVVPMTASDTASGADPQMAKALQVLNGTN